MKNKALYSTLLLLILSATGCKFFDPNKSSIPENLITEDEAKAVIIHYIQEAEDYQQYYTIDSPNFDERVRSIGWGKTILVQRIPNKKYKTYKSEGYYYILTGVMPDGQVLAAETVDAQTGENIDGQKFLSSYADILRIATPVESIEYVKTYIKGDLKCEAIYYFDGTPETGHELLTWRYLVQPKDSDAVTRGFTDTNYVLLDPWVRNFKQDNTLKSTNGFLARVGYPHRAFRFDSSKSSIDDRKMIPID